ncbi:hypothetical protein HELRODRAFT_179553 [Helobdella robusta]|uniref:Potassium channel inwardly rectifying transmembrane domain-containing protein n=1 Tax=Helobdella robusta TaxID=6412 RepID=T1FEV3_HELRO|nr:hypothetical protein HELRODRAFT_179553 [Helobdella robusta]ESN95221.1 hypothetical protein HELRODRAFT_179553 [Helobdella robusta]
MILSKLFCKNWNDKQQKLLTLAKLLTCGVIVTLSWLFFAVLWWTFTVSNGNTSSKFLDKNFLKQLHGNSVETEQKISFGSHGRNNQSSATKQPTFPFEDRSQQHSLHQSRRDKSQCLDNVPNFINSLIFSVETQTTIGYGTRVMNYQCYETLVVLMLQLLVGCIVETLVVGLFVHKLLDNSFKNQVIKFCKSVNVKNISDGKIKNELVLTFQCSKVKHCKVTSVSIEARLKVIEDNINRRKNSFLRRVSLFDEESDLKVCINKKSFDDEKVECNLNLSCDPFGAHCRKFYFLPWPTILYHHVNKKSPLWKLRRNILNKGTIDYNIEFVVKGFLENSETPFICKHSYKMQDVEENLLNAIILTKRCLSDKNTFVYENH